MKAKTALLTGLCFGAASIALPRLRPPNYFYPLYLQPALAIAAFFIAGVIAGLRHRRSESERGRLSGHAWLGVVVAVSVLVVAGFTLARTLAGRDHFFIELQLLGLVMVLVPAFLGYGAGRLIRARSEMPTYERRR